MQKENLLFFDKFLLKDFARIENLHTFVQKIFIV